MNPNNYVETMFGHGNSPLTPQSTSPMLDNNFTSLNNIPISDDFIFLGGGGVRRYAWK